MPFLIKPGFVPLQSGPCHKHRVVPEDRWWQEYGWGKHDPQRRLSPQCPQIPVQRSSQYNNPDNVVLRHGLQAMYVQYPPKNFV